MKSTARLLFILAMSLTFFGYAGCYTEWGRRNYDEMDGMYPFFALIIGAFLMLISLVFMIIHRIKK